MKVRDSLDSYDLIDQTDKRKDCASTWFFQLRDRLCAVFEDIESELAAGPNVELPPGKFDRTSWDRALCVLQCRRADLRCEWSV